MKTFLPTLISILILFCGCSDDSSLHPDYFPLKKGQRIIYDQYAAEAPEDFSSLLPEERIVHVLGDTVYDGHRYTLLADDYCNFRAMREETDLIMNEPIGVAPMRDSRKKQSFSTRTNGLVLHGMISLVRIPKKFLLPSATGFPSESFKIRSTETLSLLKENTFRRPRTAGGNFGSAPGITMRRDTAKYIPSLLIRCLIAIRISAHFR